MSHLQHVTHVDAEGGVRVGVDRDPHTVLDGDLEALDTVGSENGDDLRVGVLAKSDLEVTAHVSRRVVIEPQD